LRQADSNTISAALARSEMAFARKLVPPAPSRLSLADLGDLNTAKKCCFSTTRPPRD